MPILHREKIDTNDRGVHTVINCVTDKISVCWIWGVQIQPVAVKFGDAKNPDEEPPEKQEKQP